jgi:MoxR-like ATPase
MTHESGHIDWEDAADVWALVCAALKSGAGPIHLAGPPAIGKSYSAKMIGLDNPDGGEPTPVYSIYVTEDMSAARLVGYERFDESGASVFTPGPMLLAWGITGKPGRLVLEEIDKASGDVLTMALSALDDPAHACYILPTGERVRPRTGYQVICTSNESRNALPAALADRCAISIEIVEPHPDAIEALPANLRDAATKSVKIRDDGRRVSLRQWFAYAALMPSLGESRAAAAVFGRSADDIMASYCLGRADAPER